MSNKKFEIISLTMRYWFIGLIVFISLRIFMEAFKTKQEQSYNEEGPLGILFFLAVFLSSAYMLLAYNNPIDLKNILLF